jgi:hypothetical protein
MTQNSLNLIKELGKYWKMVDDRYVFGDGWFYPITRKKIKKKTARLCKTMKFPAQFSNPFFKMPSKQQRK